MLSEIDCISETDFEELENCTTKYNFLYNSETNIVTIAATATLADGTVEVDEITGVGFINDKDEIDAVMNIDGEGILLSEMRDAGMIQNCGWFASLIKKVAIAVAVVATVVAVAAVVVATAGAAAPALVAVGVSTTVGISAATAATAATIATVSLTVAAIAAGVAIVADVVDLTWENVDYSLVNFDQIKKQLLKGFYFLAVATSDGAMLVSPIRLPSVASAARAFNAGLSIYTPDPVEALAVTTVAGGGIPGYTEGKVHGNGYFMHYHRWDHKPKNSHAFYGGPVFY
ncbi:MAG: hypothetical protein K2I29_06040 [Clostridia bacterium]|nr:hypothetical protein [Clostridia bacterium]